MNDEVLAAIRLKPITNNATELDVGNLLARGVNGHSFRLSHVLLREVSRDVADMYQVNGNTVLGGACLLGIWHSE